MVRSLAMIAAVLAFSTPVNASSASADTARNRLIMNDFMQLFCKKKVRQAFEAYVSPDYIQHNPYIASGRDSAITELESHFAAQPASICEVHHLIVDGEMAAVHVLDKKTPEDPGIAIIDIFKLRDGKIVEHWDVVQPVPKPVVNPHPMF